MMGRLQRVLLGAALVTSLAGVGGCSVINEFEDPLIVGDWEGRAPSSKDNRLDVEVDREGDASFPVLHSDGELATDKFDVEWEQTDESRYRLELECSGTTHTQGLCLLPFTFRCDINGDGDELDCVDKTGVWASSEFHWKLD